MHMIKRMVSLNGGTNMKRTDIVMDDELVGERLNSTLSAER